METRPFGTTGLQVSVLGLGGAEIGFENLPDRTVDTILGAALDVKLTVIDTAAMYGEGETRIGRSLRGRRNQFVLFTKCGRALPPGRSWLGFQARVRGKLSRVTAGEHESPDWQPRVLEWNIEQSLRRLETDWIDLIQLHTCSEETLRRGEVIDVLQRARKAGKVRLIGYSGDGPAALYAIRCGQFDALQTSINIADQETLDQALPLALQRGMGVIAKRPIANGVWRSGDRPTSRHNVEYWQRLRELRYDFLQAGRGFEVALRFTLSAPGMHTAIVGTTNPSHLRQNAAYAAAGALSDDQFDAIRKRWKAVALPGWVGQM